MAMSGASDVECVLIQFKLDPAWLVMAGGDSKEVFAQKQRENRTLEAVYPRPSAIPERYVDSRHFCFVVICIPYEDSVLLWKS